MFRKIKRLLMILYVVSINRHYLVNGVYIFKHDSFIKANSLKNLVKGLPLLIFSFKKKHHYKKMHFRYGVWSNKYSFFYDDYIVFFVKKITINHFRSFINYVQLINYPVMTIDDYCIRKRSYSCSIIQGYSPTSKDESIKICFLLIEYAKKSDYIVSYQIINSVEFKVISYLQHGDPGLGNVIIHDGSPVFIDLDNVGYYPALYDFFDMIFNKMDLYGFELFNEGFFDKAIEEFFILIPGISFSDLDYYMALYIEDKITTIKKNSWDIESVKGMFFIQNLKFVKKDFILSKSKANEIEYYKNIKMW